MKNTAINDCYTILNASQFGWGKINALGGIQTILDRSQYIPTLTISQDDFINRLTIACQMYGQGGTLTIWNKDERVVYPERIVEVEINQNNVTYTFETDTWNSGNYYAVLKYGNKSITKYFTLNQTGRQPKIEAKIDDNKNIYVRYKLSYGESRGELRLLKQTDVIKIGINSAKAVKTYSVGSSYGEHTFSSNDLDVANYVVVLFQNGRYMASADISFESRVAAFNYKNTINIDYQLSPLTRDAYIEVTRNSVDGRLFAPISDELLGAVKSIDVDNGLSGEESFYYTDWYDGDYTIRLYQNGKETASTSISISPLGKLQKFSFDNGCAYLTYYLGETATSAYVVIDDMDGFFHVVKNLPLSSTKYSISGNFNNYKKLCVTLFVNGIAVSSKIYTR